MRSYYRVDPNPMTIFFIRSRGFGQRGTDTSEKHLLMTEAMFGLMPTSQVLPRIADNSRGWKEAMKDISLDPAEGTQPCQHLDFSLLVSRTNFSCFKPLVCGALL